MKRFFCAVLALCLLPMSTGCTFGGRTPKAPAVGDVVTLTLMLPQSHYRDFLSEALDQFELENPGVRIDPQIIPDNQWIDVVKRKVAVGETPDLIRIDVGLVIDVGIENFVELGAEEPWYGRVLPEQLESKLVGGKLYGLPVGANSSVGIAYNSALFEEYGVKVPESMEELRQACETFQRAGVIPLYASDKDSWTASLGFTAAAPQAVSADTWTSLIAGTLHWTEVPEFAEILDEFAAFRLEGYTNADYREATYASAVAAMAEGKTAMYITGQFFINDVLKQNPDLNIMMMAVPYRRGLLTIISGPGQISLFQKSAHREEAKIFLNWFSQPDNMDIFNAGWGHTAVFSDQHLQLPAWQQVLNDEYISKGNVVPQVNDILNGFDLTDFWSYQQEMLGGHLTADQVLEKWDASFSAQVGKRRAA